jgi:cytidylate kinase
MRRRDEIDSHRAIAPLKPAEDARIIDTDHLSIEQVFDKVKVMIR